MKLKNFQCKFCGYAACLKTSVLTHEKNVHKDQLVPEKASTTDTKNTENGETGIGQISENNIENEKNGTRVQKTEHAIQNNIKFEASAKNEVSFVSIKSSIVNEKNVNENSEPQSDE